MLVVRAIEASFKLSSMTRLSTSCRLGLIPGPKLNVLLSEYVITRSALKAQVEGLEGITTVQAGTRLRFSRNPFGPRVCPGSVHLEMAPSGEGLKYLRLWREACWSIPPKNAVFCPKHFNSRYGRYIRFVFGSTPPDPLNPFFRLPTLLYSIYYGPGYATLKVGTTLILKGLRRFLEQPTYLAALLRLCRNVEEARALETWLSRSSRRFSQAPSMRSRVAGIAARLCGEDLATEAGRFACALLNAVSEAAARRGGPAEVAEVLAGIRRCVRVITFSLEALPRPVRMCGSIKDAGELLGGREAVFLGIASGFLDLDVEGVGRVLVPYEFFRDRLVGAELL